MLRRLTARSDLLEEESQDDSTETPCVNRQDLLYYDTPPGDTINYVSSRMTIWIINEAGHKYDRAKKIFPDAEIRSLTLGDINPLRLDRLSYHLARGIVKYCKEGDALLISGTPIVNALTLTMWFMFYEEAKILQWNAKAQEYELTTLTRSQLQGTLDRQLLRK